MIIKTGREGKERRGSLVIRIIICPAGMPWISFPGEAWHAACPAPGCWLRSIAECLLNAGGLSNCSQNRGGGFVWTCQGWDKNNAKKIFFFLPIWKMTSQML